jgi:hypothetical protein
MSIFNSIKTYLPNWVLVEERNFSDEEICKVASAEVVESKYGLSACFHLYGGQMKFIPMSNNCMLGIGESIDMNKAVIQTLQRNNETIYRIYA